MRYDYPKLLSQVHIRRKEEGREDQVSLKTDFSEKSLSAFEMPYTSSEAYNLVESMLQKDWDRKKFTKSIFLVNLFNKYLLSIYYMPDTGYIIMGKT